MDKLMEIGFVVMWASMLIVMITGASVILTFGVITIIENIREMNNGKDVNK